VTVRQLPRFGWRTGGPTRPRAEGGLQLVIVAFKNQRFHLQRDIQNANEHLTAKPVSDASKWRASPPKKKKEKEKILNKKQRLSKNRRSLIDDLICGSKTRLLTLKILVYLPDTSEFRLWPRYRNIPRGLMAPKHYSETSNTRVTQFAKNWWVDLAYQPLKYLTKLPVRCVHKSVDSRWEVFDMQMLAKCQEVLLKSRLFWGHWVGFSKGGFHHHFQGLA